MSVIRLSSCMMPAALYCRGMYMVRQATATATRRRSFNLIYQFSDDQTANVMDRLTRCESDGHWLPKDNYFITSTLNFEMSFSRYAGVQYLFKTRDNTVHHRQTRLLHHRCHLTSLGPMVPPMFCIAFLLAWHMPCRKLPSRLDLRIQSFVLLHRGGSDDSHPPQTRNRKYRLSLALFPVR